MASILIGRRACDKCERPECGGATPRSDPADTVEAVAGKLRASDWVGVRVNVLGPIEIFGDDGRKVPLESVPARQLLAWLVLHERRSQRAEIAAALWPGRCSASARRNLRHALFTLRASLGPHVLEPSHAAIRLRRQVESDVRQFDSMACGARGDLALGLVRGDVAADLSAAWLDDAREEWRERCARLALRLAAEAEARSDAAGAIRWAHRALEFRPLDEHVTRRLMRLLAGAGDRAGALVVYCRLARRLLEQFSAEPSADTRRLAVAVRGADRRSRA